MLKYPAEFTVHTPTGPVHSCVKHARQIGIGSATDCTIGDWLRLQPNA